MYTPIKYVIAVFLTIIYIFIFVMTTFLLCPVFLLRFFLGKTVKYLNPELDSLLTPASTLLHQPRMNIVTKFLVDGELTVDEMRRTFLSKVIYCKDSNGKLKYPELQQYVYKWCGFLFWKWDRKFKIENHILEFKDEGITFRNFDELWQHLEETPMVDDRSPWEFLLVDNKNEQFFQTSENNCIVIFRLRHSLADGYSIVNLLYGDLSGQGLEKMPKSSILNTRESLAETFQKYAQLLHYFASKSFELFYNGKKFFDINEWHNGRNLDKQNFISCSLKPILMKRAKEIQLKHGVCLPSLIISIIVGALRKTLSQVNITEEIRICYPIPLKGHPERLSNHFIMAEICISMEEDSSRRLQKIKNNVELLKRGPVPLMIRIFVEIFGRLFYWMGIWITRVRWVTMCLSNFPTPGNLLLFGRHVSEFSFINGIPNGNTGVIISCMGYNGRLQLVVQIANSLASGCQLSSMSAFISDELQSLSNY